LPGDVVRDASLTYDARGLYAYMSLFPAVALSFEQMLAATVDGPYTTRRALTELVERGLVREVAP
jgi:hypothetical protein